MRIFDGVETNPVPQPQTSDHQKWLSVLQLILDTHVAAKQCRQKRVAAETERHGTFEQVMAQVGLKIPTLEQALAQFTGHTEAEQSASSPEPENQLVNQLGADAAVNTGPASTTAPAGASREPAPRCTGRASEPSSPPTSVGAASAPLKPRFDAESASLPKFRPEFAKQTRKDLGALPVQTPSPAPTRPSLVDLVKHQLDLLRGRMNAYEAELEVRLMRAEAELAALRNHLRPRPRPLLVVVPSPSDETTAPPAPAELPAARVPAGEVEADADTGPLEVVDVKATHVEPSIEIVDPAATRTEPLIETRVPATPPEAGSPRQALDPKRPRS